MIPAELKAKELLEKFKENAHGYDSPGYVKQLLFNVKQCALICNQYLIDENISMLRRAELHGNMSFVVMLKQRIEDLESIRNAIAKL